MKKTNFRNNSIVLYDLGVPRLIIARSIFFRDKKNENHPVEPFKASVPPHLEKQQQKALDEYKANEDPSLKCYGIVIYLLEIRITYFRFV